MQEDKITTEVELGDNQSLVQLTGPGNIHLKFLEKYLGIEVGSRGNVLVLSGAPDKVALGERFVSQLVELLAEGVRLEGQDHSRALHALENDETLHLRDIYGEVVLLNARRRPIKAKGLAQKQYLHAIRNHDLTFGIGPAGTGKTYLAMAMAVQALVAKEIRRIILTRPAVEAGERLGFLPGDLAEKVNPYLRPLYDALDDMMDADKVDGLLKRGQIEVAPLAFMRGRAQPYFAKVLTPDGFVPLGSLRVGSRVIGSDGRPTRVLGVFPQGPKEVFRVTTQDGASTLCCGEHLWAVRTPEDLRRGKPPRVLETRQMIGKLRRCHQRRYRLPLLSEPARMQARDVALDPYELGVLLAQGIVPIQHSRVGAVHRAVGAGALPCVATTVTTIPSSRSLSLPKPYLFNSAGVRLAVLQGLFDTDGEPVTQKDRTCRIRYATTSATLRDDVVSLVRSLGGVAAWRRRRDAYALDIRLPPEIVPFRLRRKWDVYRESGGGHPMRYIDRIEPAGEQDCLCIQVEAEDSLYVTDDFLLTHNTLNDCFVILDEAQNATSEQMRMFLTRLGYESRTVVTGDVTQVDLPVGARSGLAEAYTLLRDIEGIAFCRFTEVDVVRHPLVQRIVVAYEKRDALAEEARQRRREDGSGRDGSDV